MLGIGSTASRGDDSDPRSDVLLTAGVRPVELPSSVCISGPGSEKRTLFFGFRELEGVSGVWAARSSFESWAFDLVLALVKDLVLGLFVPSPADEIELFRLLRRRPLDSLDTLLESCGTFSAPVEIAPSFVSMVVCHGRFVL